jgi:DNA mismatch repair protein MutS2
VRLVLTGTTAPRERGQSADDSVPVFPDLLAPSIGLGPDQEALANLIDLAFLGRASAGELDDELDAMPVGETQWHPPHFADDLFLDVLVGECLGITTEGRRWRTHRVFLERVLANPPVEVTVVEYRQAILRELEEEPTLARSVVDLFAQIYHLLSLLRASRDDARLEPVRFRLDVLRAFQAVVLQMAEGFALARSGLSRLREAGQRIISSPEFVRLRALLEHQTNMASLRLEVRIGADGRVRHLEIAGLAERKGNPFYHGPLRRWLDWARVAYRRYRLGAEELVDRLVMAVYQDVSYDLVQVVQLLCHLEVYLAAMSFAARARARGLPVCLPKMENGTEPELVGLFNPLLLPLTEHPVPSDVVATSTAPIFVVTGPNSGGKTRLLQAVGIAQVLAQSGLHAPCSRARLPMVDGLFASIIELDRADQSEGRLGTELVRLRTLFETAAQGSLVLLDELCSGTNPSEAIEIVDMVLRLLRQLQPVAFVTTHFLDYAEQLQRAADGAWLSFLQAEVDGDRGPTFRFIPGVANTSLAVGTARRLGVTLDELERKLQGRRDAGGEGP